jgi:hypothetical protein
MLRITFMVKSLRSGSRVGPFGHAGSVHVELGDETFIAVDRGSVAAVVGDPRRWAGWWPDLELELLRDRGDKGRQWVLTGRVTGTAEIYLESWHDGTVVHLFLRLELPAGPPARPADRERAVHRRTLDWKRTIHQLKDELEAGREPGTTAQVGHPI